MHNTSSNTTVAHAFFAPALDLVSSSPHLFPCPEFSDSDWLHLGIRRALENVPSGRAFLQEHAPGTGYVPRIGNYFVSLASTRRLNFARDINHRLIASAELPDRLATFEPLLNYECFALDGHWIKAATHDPRYDGFKVSVGHFYCLDLRTHALRHLAAGEGQHEHDMSVLKRLKPVGLRHGVPKGKRVVNIYDRAGIDFGYWKRCQRECAVYFISRMKSNMVFSWKEDIGLDREDARNLGIRWDMKVLTKEKQELRVVLYLDPLTGESFEFLTNEMDLPAWVIVELYRRRWDVEKVFDELETKLGEKKAWGTSSEARQIQGQLAAITHNLLLIYETKLAAGGIRNEAEDKRRARRREVDEQVVVEAGGFKETLAARVAEATQRSVKFIRWLRMCLRQKLTAEAAEPILQASYASL